MQTMRTKGFSHGHVPVTALKVRGKGKRSYAFSEDFEDKSVQKILTSSCEDIHFIEKKLVPDLYEPIDQYK